MESYQILYRIAVKHSYFGGKHCTALACKLTLQSMLLIRRRGLLFRQMEADEWMIFYDSMGEGPDTEHDVLELEITEDMLRNIESRLLERQAAVDRIQIQKRKRRER